MDKPVYLDNNATTPVDPRVLDAMLPYLKEVFGNPASRSHAFGWEAEKAVDKARRHVADLLGASAREILFTSGATEADNLALKGVVRGYKDQGNHIVTCRTEHKAVLDTCAALEAEGVRFTYLDPCPQGRVTPEQVEAAIEDDTILVALMFANNEIGTVHPIAEVGAVCKQRKVLFFTDAAQAVGKVPIDVEAMGIDLLSLSGHKLYAPKGVGALYVRRRKPTVRLEPILHGGGHERGMRSGTLNVPGIVALGEACRLSHEDLEAEVGRLAAMRDRFETAVLARLPHVKVNGCPEHRLPGTTNLAFKFTEGETLMMNLTKIAVSSGSACSSASLRASHVLTAIGLEAELAHASLRFSFGRLNEESDVDVAIDAVVEAVERLRPISPRYDEGESAA